MKKDKTPSVQIRLPREKETIILTDDLREAT